MHESSQCVGGNIHASRASIKTPAPRAYRSMPSNSACSTTQLVPSEVQAPHAPFTPRSSASPSRRRHDLALAAVANACAHPVFDERAKELQAHEIVYPIISFYPRVKLIHEHFLLLQDGIQAVLESDPPASEGLGRVALVRLFATRSSSERRGVHGEMGDPSLQFFRFKYRCVPYNNRLSKIAKRYPRLYGVFTSLVLVSCALFFAWCSGSWIPQILMSICLETLVCFDLFCYPHVRARIAAHRARAV